MPGFKRKRSYKRKSTKSTAKRVKKVERKVNSLVKAELRQNSTYVAAGTIPQAGVRTLMNGMLVGVGDNTRSGNKIIAKYLEMRIDFGLDGTALVGTTAQNYVYRLLILWDKQPNGALPVINDLLLNSGAAGNNYYSPVNFNFKARYKVFYDKTWSIAPHASSRQAIGTTTYDSYDKHVIVRKKLNRTTVYNNGTAGDVTDIISNALIMIEFTNSNVNVISASRCNLVYEP